MEEFAVRNPAISFLHTAPGIVKTPGARELPLWARIPTNMILAVSKPFIQDLEDTGKRQLFMATSARFPPAEPSGAGTTSAGVHLIKDLEIAKGSDDVKGSGSYLVGWTGETNKNVDVITDYRRKDVGKTIYDHIMGVFDQVERANSERKIRA
jgi:hypothetical protein